MLIKEIQGKHRWYEINDCAAHLYVVSNDHDDRNYTFDSLKEAEEFIQEDDKLEDDFFQQ